MRLSTRLFLVALLSAFSCGDGGADRDWIVPREEAPPSDLWLAGERLDHDFGAVRPDSIHITEFALEAEGSGPVVVEKMVRSCGCTEGELYWLDEGGQRQMVELNQEYPVGSKFVLVATLNTKGKVGAQEQKVQIVLQGAAQPVERVLRAQIHPFLEFEPPAAEFGTFRTFEEALARVHVTSATGEPFRVTSITGAGPADEFTFEPEEPDAEGRASAGWLNLRLAPGRAAGRLAGTVVVATDVANPNADGNPHRASTVLTGAIEGAISTTPDRLSFGPVKPGVRSVRKILVRNYDPNFQLQSFGVRVDEGPNVGASPEFVGAFSFEAKELEEGRVWELEVGVEGLPGEGNVSGALTLAVGHPLQEELRVPVSARLPSAGS